MHFNILFTIMVKRGYPLVWLVLHPSGTWNLKVNSEQTYPQSNSQHHQEVNNEHHYVRGAQWRLVIPLLRSGNAGALSGLHAGQSHMLTKIVVALTFRTELSVGEMLSSHSGLVLWFTPLLTPVTPLRGVLTGLQEPQVTYYSTFISTIVESNKTMKFT